MVYEKNGALKSTYYYFGWEELNHFIPLCASFLHFGEPIHSLQNSLPTIEREDLTPLRRPTELHNDSSSEGAGRAVAPLHNVTFL